MTTLRSNRVLIVEAEPVVADRIAEWLAVDGIETRVAGKAADVVPAIMAFVPDAVILDVTLHDGDAATLEREITERFGVPVILSTGSRYDGPRNVALLVKPYTMDELLRTVRRVLGVA